MPKSGKLLKKLNRNKKCFLNKILVLALITESLKKHLNMTCPNY